MSILVTHDPDSLSIGATLLDCAPIRADPNPCARRADIVGDEVFLEAQFPEPGAEEKARRGGVHDDEDRVDYATSLSALRSTSRLNTSKRPNSAGSADR